MTSLFAIEVDLSGSLCVFTFPLSLYLYARSLRFCVTCTLCSLDSDFFSLFSHRQHCSAKRNKTIRPILLNHTPDAIDRSISACMPQFVTGQMPPDLPSPHLTDVAVEKKKGNVSSCGAMSYNCLSSISSWLWTSYTLSVKHRSSVTCMANCVTALNDVIGVMNADAMCSAENSPLTQNRLRLQACLCTSRVSFFLAYSLLFLSLLITALFRPKQPANIICRLTSSIFFYLVI